MKYHKIDRNLFIKNRKNFAAKMQANSIAVFNSNDIYPVSADSTLPFEQHRDIFYLSGVDQEESILVLFPDCPNPKNREMLFLKETNEHIAVWEGEKLTKDAAFDDALPILRLLKLAVLKPCIGYKICTRLWQK